MSRLRIADLDLLDDDIDIEGGFEPMKKRPRFDDETHSARQHGKKKRSQRIETREVEVS